MTRISNNKNKIRQKINSLERESQEIKALLNHELEVTKGQVANMGKIALGVGSGLVFSVILLRGLLGGKGNSRPPRRVYQRFKHQLMGELSMHATNLLLGIAKDKLAEYKKKQDHAENKDSGLAN